MGNTVGSTLNGLLDRYGGIIGAGLGVAGSLLGKSAATNAQVGGYQQAQQIGQLGTDKSLQALLSMYDQSRNSLTPFTQYAQPAMAKLAAYSGITAPASQPGSGNVLDKIMAGGNSSYTPASSGMGGTGVQPGEATRETSLATQKRSDIGSLAGLGAGIGGAVGASALGITGMALTSLIPIIGPIAAGVGALIGKLWNNNNPSKDKASDLINEVSREVWGADLKGSTGLIADFKSGKLTKDQARMQFDVMWNGWISNMKKAGVDESIISRSIADQTHWFEPARQLLGES